MISQTEASRCAGIRRSCARRRDCFANSQILRGIAHSVTVTQAQPVEQSDVILRRLHGNQIDQMHTQFARDRRQHRDRWQVSACLDVREVALVDVAGPREAFLRDSGGFAQQANSTADHAGEFRIAL